MEERKSAAREYARNCSIVKNSTDPVIVRMLSEQDLKTIIRIAYLEGVRDAGTLYTNAEFNQKEELEMLAELGSLITKLENCE